MRYSRCLLGLVLLFAVGGCGGVSEEQRKASLAQIGAALNTYHAEHRGYPRADGPRTPTTAEAAKTYKTGLSWRVHILKQLGQQKLYDRFKLDEPWDSTANASLVAEMPAVYRSAGTSKPGETCFHVLLGPKEIGDAFLFTNPRATPVIDESTQPDVKDGVSSTRKMDVTDGLANTIMAVEAGPSTAEPWTKPGGLVVDESDPKVVLRITGRDVLLLIADGKVQKVSLEKLSDAKFLALLTRSGSNYSQETEALNDR